MASNKEICTAPAGKFKVVRWVEDLDCISPIDDWPVEVGVCDTLEEADKLRIKNTRVFSKCVIYDDAGNVVKFF